MSQTSYYMHVQRAIQKIANRFKNEHVEDAVTQVGPVPPYVNNFYKKVDVDENVSGNSGPVSVIDVQCDYRPIIMAICFHITKEYPEMNIRAFPAMTPPALMAYNYALLLIHALLNDDANIRKTQSKSAHEIRTTKYLDRLLSMFRNLPVPPYMLQFIQGLKSGYDERKKNLLYVNTLACYDMLYDFGRTPPIMVYLMAHNLIASKPGNAPPDEIFTEWVNTEVIAAPVSFHVGNYIGTHDTQNVYINWFAHMNRTLFNPVTNRTNTVRPTLMRTDLIAQRLEGNVESINPYIHLLGLDPENMRLIETHLKSVASCINETYSNCPSLGSLIVAEKNNMILNHYYSPVLLPTYHGNKIHMLSTTQRYINATAAQFATAQHFKVKKIFDATQAIPFPSSKVIYNPELYLAINKKYNSKLDPLDQPVFDPLHDVLSDVRHFCPYETSNEAIYSNAICGRVIETDELTSCSVPQPNPNNSIMTENCFFLESAIPLSHIMPIFGAQTRFNFVRTTPSSSRVPHVRLDIVDRSIDRLPIFPLGIYGDLGNPLHGYHPVLNIQSPRYGCNSICTTINRGINPTQISAPLRKVIAWSSYRYYNVHQNDTVAPRNKKCMLLNFRTLHGTNVTLVETPHPAIMIPRS